MIEPVSSSTAAYLGIGKIEDFLRGKNPSLPLYAELHGGSDLKFDDIKLPDVADLAQQGVAPVKSCQARLRATVLAAIKRDAVHAYASRGTLMRHGWQRAILTVYEHGRALELTE